jgi:hypothetical protein
MTLGVDSRRRTVLRLILLADPRPLAVDVTVQRIIVTAIFSTTACGGGELDHRGRGFAEAAIVGFRCAPVAEYPRLPCPA